MKLLTYLFMKRCLTRFCLHQLFAGLALVVAAICLLLDTERVLLSRVIVTTLPQPLFYYAAILFIFTGLIVSSLSIIGCWATYCRNNCFLGIFIFLILVLLVIESVISILAVVCPKYLGITFENGDELLDTWQRHYGVPGREQFTAAVDLIQTRMHCCGVEGSGDYSTTWWRLRELAVPDLLVPLSCCIQQDPPKYLDPDPINATQCQNNRLEIYQQARYTQGCLTQLEYWLKEQILTAVYGVVILVILQLLMLFFAILMCIKSASGNCSGVSINKINCSPDNCNYTD